MGKFLKEKGATILVVVATVILAGVAVFTALRLYQVRQESVSPAVPESEPAAGFREPTPGAKLKHCTSLIFALTTETPTPTLPQSTATPTPTTIVTSTPTPRNTTTPTPESTSTPTPTTPVGGPSTTITPTPTDVSATNTPVAPTTTTILTEPELPPAGVGMPTLIAGAIGGLLILLSLALAF